MGGKKVGNNHYSKPDFWSKKAFSEGYPARSVYKLKEMNEKFGLIKHDISILDLGAAPGSWTTFVLRSLENSGKIVSVDLSPLSEKVHGSNLSFFQGDLYDEEIRTKVESLGPYQLVISDAAPATTGNRAVDTARSEGLVELVLFYAEQMLCPGGNFVVKVFQGGGEQKILAKMRTLFTTARAFKPEACRSESFETYFIGLKKK